MSELHDMPSAETKPEAPAPAVPAKSAGIPKELVRTIAIGMAVGIGAIAVIGTLVLVLGIYKLGWDNTATRIAARTLSLPAASVNGEAVPYSTYYDDVATVRRFFAKQQEQGGSGMVAPEDGELRKGVLDRLIATEILKQEADKRDITVDQAAIDTEYQNFVQAEGTGDAEAQILDLYGWTVDQFKQKVMVPYLLQQKLTEALANDADLAAANEAKAKDLLQKLKDGANFEDLARENSTDLGSGANGGDLGEFGKGVMVPEFETAAFALKKGELSDLVKTQFGWHIIRVDEVIKDKKGAVTGVKAHHILVGNTDAEKYLDQKLAEAKVERYVPGLE